jgi:uncharacterized protein YjbI with pentapeptide repeats
MNADELKIILSEHKLWLYGSGGKRADLRKANLTKANLIGANLSWANLSWADLSKANLSWADLSKANLSWANLSWADLSKANLSGVNLSWADLTKADLREADLSGVNLSEAEGLHYAQCSFSSHGECGRQLSGVIINGELRLFCGCFQGTLVELDAYIDSGEERYKPTRKLARDFIVAAIDAARKEQG